MVDRFAHPELLMTPEWLHAHLADSTVRVVDTRAAKSYAEGHIPGAVPLDVYSLNVTDTSADGMRAWIGQMEEALSAAGVADGQTVVFYEDVAGQFATRGLWALVYFGHDGGRLLDGGLNAWKAAGYSVTTDAPPVARTSFRARPRPEEVATYEDILARLEDGQTQIVDVRREGEFLGTEIRAPRGGRIPGAVHLDWVHNLDENGRLKSPAALDAQYAGLGLDRSGEVITYCQGGYRAANTWLVLRLLGYPRVRNYVGSWAEWGSRDGLPIESLTLPEKKD